MSYIGYYHAVQSLWHAGALTILIGLLVSCLGINFLLRFFPAFAVLIFLIPVPGAVRQAIAGPSQTATAAVTQIVLETLGVPVERSGNLLTLNGHDVAVAEACNGMRMVFALILVSFAFAFTMPLRPLVRMLILAASPVAAVFCNSRRMTPTVILYGYFPGRVADLFHDVAGWAMLPIAFVMLLGVIKLFRWALIPVSRYNLAYE
jgi:exosortase